MTTLSPLPSSFRNTCNSLHALAEHVLSTARYQRVERFVLQLNPRGFETPPFGEDNTVLAVEGIELVVTDNRGSRRTSVTTIRAAAAFVGVEPGLPRSLWEATTPLVLDATLDIDPLAVQALADWYEFSRGALTALRDRATADTYAPIQLFPQGFDLATNAAEVNYGGSPGDSFCDEPYLYVGPVNRPFPTPTDSFWNAGFGALLRYSEMKSHENAVEFLWRGRELCSPSTSNGASSK